MTQYLKTFLFAACFFCFSPFLPAQHPAWEQYSTANGLPSNAVYGMLEDKQGFLWFSTDLGICRFNGYEFHQPVDTSTLAGSEAFRLTEDPEGRVWFNRLDASVWLVENDTIRAWKYNYIIRQYDQKFISLGTLIVDKNGVVWMQLPNLGILVVQPDGTHQVLPSSLRNAFVMTSVNGKAIIGNISNNIPDKTPGLSPEILIWKEGRLSSLARFRLDPSQLKEAPRFGAWCLRNGDFIYNYLGTFYLIHNNQLIATVVNDLIVNEIYEDTNGALLVASCEGEKQGLLLFRSFEYFKKNEFSNILPKHNIACTLRSQDGSWWVATIDAGIFYCKNPDINIYDSRSGLSYNDVQSITSDEKSTIYASLRPSGIFAIQAKENVLKQLPAPSNQINSGPFTLRFDTATQRLWYNPYLCYFEKNHWKNIRFVHPGFHNSSLVPLKKISASHAGRLWWAGSFRDFYAIDPVKCTVTRLYSDLSHYWRTHAVAQDYDGNIWVAVEGKGLCLWRNNKYEKPPFDHPALHYPVRLVDILPDSTLLVSLRGGGLLFRKKNGQFTHLSTSDGLSTNWFHELYISPDGVVYACSSAGLNILSPQKDGGWHIEILGTQQGLPSNQINNVTLLNGELWIATDRGLVQFKTKSGTALVPMPVMERFIVNNRSTSFSDNLLLPYQQNNIAIQFFALHYRSGGHILYRYRLVGADTTYVQSYNREVNFLNLPPGQYHFEVQAQTGAAVWGESAHWSFRIQPPWWATWWFRLSVLVILCAAGFVFYRSRLRAIHEEAAEKEKIRDLEAAALRAQMNPHFIFNCLQAIQSFIARNDGNSATTYLARFARLVRLTLHGSVDGQHTLAEEISMLENYLQLEQMRFRGQFEFDIQISPGINPEEISLPPLLVQPFVENALMHGLKDRESGGRVDIHFTQKGDCLEVTITDNGKGFTQAGKTASEKKAHHSVGMMLTQKRLDLLAGADKDATALFHREEILDGQGRIMGTCIRFEVPVLHE